MYSIPPWSPCFDDGAVRVGVVERHASGLGIATDDELAEGAQPVAIGVLCGLDLF